MLRFVVLLIVIMAFAGNSFAIQPPKGDTWSWEMV